MTAFEVAVGLAPRVTLGLANVSLDGRKTSLSDQALLRSLGEGLALSELDHRSTTVPGHTVREIATVFHERGLLSWRLMSADRVIAEAVPLMRGVAWPEMSVTPADCTLSRFAHVVPDDSDWLIESGTSPWRVRMSAEGLAALVAQDGQVGRFLDSFGLLAGSDTDAALAAWEPLDLLFATRTRLDLDSHEIGATHRFRGLIDSPAFDVADEFGDDIVPLPPASDLPAITHWDLIDTRRTVRTFDSRPVALHTVSQLLATTVQCSDLSERDANSPDGYDSVLKPVPTSGAMGAVDVWVVAHQVVGLPEGTWWYDPLRHHLHRTGGIPELRADAPEAPLVVLMAMRHERLAWRYQRIALAVALKDAGVITHAMQLAAAALGLGSLPWGTDSMTQASRVMGVNPYRWMPIGELFVGHAHAE